MWWLAWKSEPVVLNHLIATGVINVAACFIQVCEMCMCMFGSYILNSSADFTSLCLKMSSLFRFIEIFKWFSRVGFVGRSPWLPLSFHISVSLLFLASAFLQTAVLISLSSDIPNIQNNKSDLSRSYQLQFSTDFLVSTLEGWLKNKIDLKKLVAYTYVGSLQVILLWRDWKTKG